MHIDEYWKWKDMDGRTNRVQYWTNIIIVGVCFTGIYVAEAHYFRYIVYGVVYVAYINALPIDLLPAVIASILFGGTLITNLWLYLITAVRRLHDINAWKGWVVFMFIPIVNIVFLLVIGCIPGYKATNEYGVHHN